MGLTYIINTMTAWEEPPRARHQVTYALAKRYEVAFLAANKIGWPRIESFNPLKNIQVIQPYFPVDFRFRYRIPIVNEIYQLWLFRKLKRKYSNVEVINFDFSAHLIHSFFKKVTYYCNDNFASISRKINVWPIYKYHSFCERKIASRAMICIGTSAIITENLRTMNSNSYEIPLGGPDIDEYAIQPMQKREIDATIKIGLVGFIRNYNLSYQLLNDILEQIDCTITLIGPVEPEFYNSINHKDRVFCKGILTDKKLLDAVNEFDIAIAPYLDKKIKEGGTPNKLFIYLALGKPIVATELDSLVKMNLPDKLIYLVGNVTEFPSRIIQAHEENSPELIKKRANYAKENTWDNRIDKMIEIMKSQN
jgi:hypothetical protein